MAKYVTLPVLKFKAYGNMASVGDTEYYAVIGGRYYWLGCGGILHNVFESVAKTLHHFNVIGEGSFVYGEKYLKHFHNLKTIPKPVMRTLKVYR